MQLDAIVLAAGLGVRTKLDYPKQLMMLNGKPLFIHVLDQLEAIKEIDKLIVTVIPERLDEFIQLTDEYQHANVLCVPGGECRQESVYRALQYCETERILIHAASRPFFSKENVENLMSINADVVVPCVPMACDAMMQDGSRINGNNVLCIQLPQIYKTELLRKAHEKGRGKHYSEDSELVYKETGIAPTIVNGWEENIKITLPSDVLVADLIFNHLGLYNYLNKASSCVVNLSENSQNRTYNVLTFN